MIINCLKAVLTTPGCQDARHPGVRRTETRMSGIPTPGCQHAWDPGVIQLVYIAQIFLEYISFHSFLVL